MSLEIGSLYILFVQGGLTGWVSCELFEKFFIDDRAIIRSQLLDVQLGLENKNLPLDYSVKTESRALA